PRGGCACAGGAGIRHARAVRRSAAGVCERHPSHPRAGAASALPGDGRAGGAIPAGGGAGGGVGMIPARVAISRFRRDLTLASVLRVLFILGAGTSLLIDRVVELPLSGPMIFIILVGIWLVLGY